MARTNMNLPDEIDRDMRHEAVDLGLRYPGEFVKFLWEQYKKYKEVNTVDEFAKALGFTDYLKKEVKEMNIEEAKKIINDYVNDIDNFVTDDFLKVDDSKGKKVINWRKGRYGWRSTNSYYTPEQVEKLKTVTDVYDVAFEIDGIFHTFKL